MPAAPLPSNEEARLADLHSFDILDTGAEPGFDRITSLAARLFGVPMALVSLVDRNRQWFKSCIGISGKETSRDVAFCAYAIFLDDPLVISDARNDPRFADNPMVTGPPYVRFYAGAPLRTRTGYTVGTLCLVDVEPRELSLTEIATLVDLSRVVVDELELHRLSRQHAEQSLMMRAVLDSVGDGVIVVNPEGQFTLVNPVAQRLVGGTFTSSHTTHEWVQRRAAYLPDKKTPFPKDMSPLQRALRGESSDDVEIFMVPPDSSGLLVSVTARPVLDEKNHSHGGVATFRDITALRAAEEALAQLAVTDPLTCLPNQRAFRERLELLIAEGARGRKFALVMADVDHFKAVNDNHGHPVGDKVLHAVAQALSRRVRKTDLVARYGGEEFCVLLTDVDVERAGAIAEELRAAVAAITEPVAVTASFGVCGFGPKHSTSGTLVAAADAALYRAKRDGRNRVVAAD